MVSVSGFSQETMVRIYGYAINESNGKRLNDILVVNKRTGDFAYGDSSGNYILKVKKEDIVVFSAQGYASVSITLKDSVQKESYFVVPTLNRYQIFLREVSIKAERKVADIKLELDEINVIGKIRETDDLASPMSPISFFYTRFNKRENRKQRIEQQKIADRKRILLKELFDQFVRYDNIELTHLESREFINQLDVSFDAINFSSEYELLSYLKLAYKKWKYKTSEDYVSPNPIQKNEKKWKN